ncbi:MAG: aminopeptidase N [Dermatophilaceae bacterium]
MPGDNLTRDEAADRAALVDVTHYDVVLDFTTGPSTFATTTRIRFTARRPGADTWVDFVGDCVQRIVLNGVALDPATHWSDSRIRVGDLAADNELLVEATGQYTNSGEGIHRFVDPIDGEVYLYSQFEVPDARRAFAVFEQPDLKANFAFTVRAPSHWTVVSNEPTPEPATLGDGTSRWVFPPTPRLPCYVTAVCAGPYDVVRDEVVCRDAVVPLGLFSRRSLAHHVDADNVFDVTKKGLRYFEHEFGTGYPFTKYDQIFVPEYNAGAMENAGCVTITEVYVFRGQAPDPLVERRAMTILHEIAHMWFGDLVTMRWWDDLWLNESFAEWAASVCQAEATQWEQAWTTFRAHEKAWAYQQDQQPDTHPVYADMRDLHDVAVNFDGITYAKGGAVLKQLVSYVGREAFRAGMHSYFRKHAWANTTMADLFVELEVASGRDLSDWAGRWLRTAGVNTLTVSLQTDDHDIVTSATMTQTGQPGHPTLPGQPGHPTLRPHRLGIGSFALLGGRLERKDGFEVDVDGPATPLPQLVGRPRPSLLLPNDADLTYAKVRLDPPSLQTALGHPEAFTDSLARSLVTGSLWELMRDGELAPRAFIDYLLRCVPVEDHSTALRTILSTTKQIPSMLLAAVNWCTQVGERAAIRERVAAALRAAAESAAAGSDAQLQLVTAYASVATAQEDTARVRATLEGDGPFAGFIPDQDARWGLLFALAAAGAVDAGRIDAELARDPSVAGHERALAAKAARPTAEAKAQAWALAIEADTQTNAAVEHLGKGFRRANDAEGLLGGYIERYHDMLLPTWQSRSFAIASRCVEYFYPLDLANVALRDASRAWLAANPEAPSGLRRAVIEQLTLVEIAVRAQEHTGG